MNEGLYMITRYIAVLFSIILLCGCSSESQTGNGSITYSLEVAFPGLTFDKPVDLKFPEDGSSRMFLVEQDGRIWVFENNSETTEKSLFLDIAGQVDSRGWEEGLLGLAFHPEFANNGFFYVNYTATNPDRTVISRFQVDPNDANLAMPASELVILTFEQPYSNHNGGCMVFGPDGYLYTSAGDGGSGGDPLNNGQDRTTLLGTILRIDVDNPSGGRNYGIPPDNPFAGNDSGFAEEIFSYGLRNVWRFSFDPETGTMWGGDVGQDRIEEVDIIEAGKNYGWNIMEGSECFRAQSCDTTGLIMPIVDYTHQQGQSITGGYIYRGSRLPDLVGKYIYADFMTGRIWALAWDGETASVTRLKDDGPSIASFAVDQNNDLYMLVFDGKVYRLVRG